MGYDLDLSICANQMADELGLSMAQRMSINQDNIEKVLGLPAYYGEKVPTNHISDRRMKQLRKEKREKKALANKPQPKQEKRSAVLDLVSDEERPPKRTFIDLVKLDEEWSLILDALSDEEQGPPLKRARHQ